MRTLIFVRDLLLVQGVLLAAFGLVTVLASPPGKESDSGRFEARRDGRRGVVVWCRNGAARCWWEASRTCGSRDYSFVEGSAAWVHTGQVLGSKAAPNQNDAFGLVVFCRP